VQDPWSLRQLLSATQPVNLAWFERGAVDLARTLLGCVLLRGETAGMIVEAEAYLGGDDLAAHASRGKTERTTVLFGPAGRAYVYLSYGMHECLNVVAQGAGGAESVLIRALEPLCGLNVMRARRNWQGSTVGLANGPGKLTQALGITRADYGRRMDRGELRIREWRKKPEFEIGVTPRVGISKCIDWPLRFVWRGNAFVSR